MKNRSVTLDGTSIQLVDSIGELNDGIVMNEVAKPLTREFCRVVGESKGDILDIGFGLGFSADFFNELGVNTYTCIELNDEIYEKACDWANDKSNVTIIKGDWIEVIPTLTKKFDGIFMDTYGDSLDKYKLFESYSKAVAKEGCILSLWEYPSVRNLEDLNFRIIPIHQNDYRLLLKPQHRVCWTYYFAGEFRKKQFYKKLNIIPKDLCESIINENEKEGFVKDTTSAIVDGIEHRRDVWIKDLINSPKLFNLIKEYIFPYHNTLSSEDIYFCKLIKYTKGCRHDRHLESDKYSSFLSEEQYKECLVVTLNSNFKGGEFIVYDSWVRDDRGTFSHTETKTGDVIVFKPYQHCRTFEIIDGIKYEIFIKLKNKELKQIHRTII